MDTRTKILTCAAARALPRGHLAVVTGTFNPLVAAHARQLAAVRDRTGGRPILAIVLPAEPELLPIHDRAGVVAALRMVDYVLISDRAETEKLIDVLAPIETVRLEADDAIRTSQLIQHVHSRQIR